MVFNYDLLRGRIYNQSSVPEVAHHIRVAPATLRRRLRGKPFSNEQIIRIANYLGINLKDSLEMNSYFFNIECSQKRTK